jgi:DnaJ-class molecular chaperone
MNYYKILQVTEDADPEVIEAAYKRLSFKYHPDRNNSPNANVRMMELNEAYNVLSDPNRRQYYDDQCIRDSAIENHPQAADGIDWFDAAFKVASTINGTLGSPCPNCGTKSLIHQKKLERSVLDYITGSQKYQCRNCGFIHSL